MSAALPIPGPLSLGELLDRAFRLYRSRFGSFVLTAAVFLVPYALVATLVTGSSMMGYFNLFQSLSQTPVVPPEEAFTQVITPLGQFFGATLLVSLVGIVVNVLVLLALTAQSVAAVRGQPATLGQVVRTALRRFWSYLGMMILSGLAYLGVLIVVGILFALIFAVFVGGLGGLAFALSDNETAGVVAAVGMFVTVICLYGVMILLFAGPLLYLGARWYVATPGIIDQEWKASESLRGSWRLTKGSVLRCMGYAILLFVLGMIIVAVPVYVLQWMLFIVLPSSALLFASALSMAASSILSVLWQPLSAIAVVLLYFDLRVRQESYDLTLRVQQLEAELQPFISPVVAPMAAQDARLPQDVQGDEQVTTSYANEEPPSVDDAAADDDASTAAADSSPDALASSGEQPKIGQTSLEADR